jgi:hypothetical protein
MTCADGASVHVTREWGRLEDVIVGIEASDGFILAEYQLGWSWMPERFARLWGEHVGEQLIDADPESARLVQVEWMV